MVDMSSISALATSLRMAGDITKTAIDLRDGQLIQAKVIELQGVILSAQSSALSAQADQFTLIERIRTLEKEVDDLKAWGAKAEEYELKQVGTGAFAYMRKPDAQPPEPTAWLCVNCFENHHRRSILQHRGRAPKDNELAVYGCASCHAEIQVRWSTHPGRENY